MIKLEQVTLIGADCVDPHRLWRVIDWCLEKMDFGQVKLLTHWQIPECPYWVEIEPINSRAEYSRFCIKHLHEHIDTTHLLIVQHDGYIMDAEMWTDEYLDYDYIGPLLPIGLVGNGGFSLRTSHLMRLVAEVIDLGEDPKSYDPEDIRIAGVGDGGYRRKLQSHGIKFAPPELARKFAINRGAWSGQFGVHGTPLGRS